MGTTGKSSGYGLASFISISGCTPRYGRFSASRCPGRLQVATFRARELSGGGPNAADPDNDEFCKLVGRVFGPETEAAQGEAFKGSKWGSCEPSETFRTGHTQAGLLGDRRTPNNRRGSTMEVYLAGPDDLGYWFLEDENGNSFDLVTTEAEHLTAAALFGWKAPEGVGQAGRSKRPGCGWRIASATRSTPRRTPKNTSRNSTETRNQNPSHQADR